MTKVKSLSLKSLRNFDFSYYVDYDYDRRTSEDHYRNCDDICRCTTIANAEVKSFDHIYDAVNALIKYYDISTKKDNTILFYCFERMLSRFDINSFEFYIDSGYYGQEINDIKVSCDKFIEIMDNLVNQSDNDRIKSILKFEYGYLLPVLETANFTVEEIMVDSILPAQEEHYRKLDVNAIKKYDELLNKDKKEFIENILGIVKCKNGKYSLVDGYHRYWTVKDKVEKIKVLSFNSI